MRIPDHYRLTFTDGRLLGGGATTDQVVVDRTEALGPGGNPVYCDSSGILRAEISAAGEVRMLASSGYQTPMSPTAEPIP